MTNGLILAPLGLLYSAVMRVRRTLYQRKLLTVHQTGSPVISVGNITTGGTGKTPLVEWVARVVSKEGLKVCILTRGYGRAQAGSKRVVVSDGERILADAREGGDEPRLLAEELQGRVAVISDADRVAAARWAGDHFHSEVFILDDGFQHLRIARDLDLVTIDASAPWGGAKLLPQGRLREPLAELARADCIIITRTEQAQDVDSLRKQVERFSGGRPTILSRTRTKAVRPLASTKTEEIVSDTLTHHSSLITHHSLPQPVAAFCAIGNPSAFFEQIRREGYKLEFTRAFPDHHFFVQSDVDALISEARPLGAQALLTTAKDAVKLRTLNFEIPCYVLEIELEFDDEEKLRGMILEAIRG